MGYIAFVLDEESKTRLIEQHPPKYDRVLAHHVTLKFGVSEDKLSQVMDEFGNFEFVTVRGYACDDGADCVAVITDTGYGEKANGTVLHVTLSVAAGYSAVHGCKTAQLVTQRCGTWVLRGKIEYLD